MAKVLQFLVLAVSSLVCVAAQAQSVDLQRACREQYGADYQPQLRAPGGPNDWLCVKSAAAAPAGRGIQVLAGTYGQNCGQPRGNKTPHLAAACGGKDRCEYAVQVTAIGDPAHGCAKDYVAEWQCPGSGTVHRTHANPEAGYGSKLTLACSAAPGGSAGLVDVLTIPNDRPLRVESKPLEAGRWYIVEASGVVTDWSHVKDGVDAVWCYAEWRCGKGEAWNQLRIDDKGLSDHAGGTLPYNPDHVYRVRIQGQGKPLVAHSSDAQSSWGDNAGAFTVRIYTDGAVALSVPAGPGRSYTSRPRAAEAIPADTGRSYTSRPRAAEAVPTQAAPSKGEEILKKAVEDAIKGLFRR